MKVLIKKSGILYIERGDKLKIQICPRTTRNNECGDWCPLFREPYDMIRSQIDYYPHRIKSIKNTYLQICERTIVVSTEDFSDERKENESE